MIGYFDYVNPAFDWEQGLRLANVLETGMTLTEYKVLVGGGTASVRTASSAAAPSPAAYTEDDSPGACGFPLSLANAASQDGMAGVEGGCAWLAESVGADATEAAGTPAAAPTRSAQLADGGKLGDCGIPYPDEEARLDQAFFAKEGECDEYVAEIEAEGY